MPIDNRKVLQNILLPETSDSTRRTLTGEDADEITQIFSQERLDKFVADGVLEGDWKATKTGRKLSKTPELPTEAELGKMNKAKLVAQAETEGVSVTPDADTNQQIIDKILAAREEE